MRICGGGPRGRAWMCAGVLLLCAGSVLYGQSEATTAPTSQVVTTSTSDLSSESVSTQTSGVVNPAEYYGLWVMTPALLAIFLAITTRQVIVALTLGVLTAAGMSCVMRGDYNPLHFVIYMMDTYVLGVLGPMKKDRSGVDLEHITIIIYTLFIGAMIGTLTVNGGTRALVNKVTHQMQSPRAAQLGAWIAGVLVFIDDYASAMIVGPGLRPVFDRSKLSREKLAHFVNWTAAPVSSIFLGTWLAVQIGWIDTGLDSLGDEKPAYLAGMTATSLFWSSIPYRTYTVMVIISLLLIAILGRDFGAMRLAEERARNQTEPSDAASTETADVRDTWILAALPGGLLVAMTVGLMALTGYEGSIAAGEKLPFESIASGWESLGVIFGNTDSHFALLYASLASAVLAIVMTVGSRTLSLTQTMDGAVKGMTAMFTATIILVLAWGLGAASKELQLGQVAGEFLDAQIHAGRFSVTWLPLAIFLTACLISFSTGSSWTTMAILVPMTIGVSAGLLVKLPPDEARFVFQSCIGSAMAGAVFGNTCSPLADVTVLSATFSSCDAAAHFRTVFPYAIVVAVISVVCTDGVRFVLGVFSPKLLSHWSVWHGLLLGTGMMCLVLMVFGRRAVSPAR